MENEDIKAYMKEAVMNIIKKFVSTTRIRREYHPSQMVPMAFKILIYIWRKKKLRPFSLLFTNPLICTSD